MKLRGIFVWALLLFLVFSVFNLGSVSAQTPAGQPVLTTIVDSLPNSISTFFNLKGVGIGGAFVAWFVLALVILLIYSALTSVEFPKGGAIRLGLSIVVGVLSVTLIRMDEIVAAMQSYRALGVALVIFFPTLILAFFTFVVASKGRFMGIYIQRILWLVYSVYMFIQVGMLLIAKWINLNGEGFAAFLGTSGPDKNTFLGGLFTFLWGPDYMGRFAAAGDTTTLIILLAVSVTLFYMFVIKNRTVTEWLITESRLVDLQRVKDTAERARSADEIKAEETRTHKKQ